MVDEESMARFGFVGVYQRPAKQVGGKPAPQRNLRPKCMEGSRPSVNPPSNGPSDRNAWSVRPQRRRGRIFEKRTVQLMHNGCTTLFVCVGFRRDDPSGASEPRLASGLLFLRGSLYTVSAGTSFTISGPGRAHRATRLSPVLVRPYGEYAIHPLPLELFLSK